ncbi:PREDICTED: uncharacterized protein LOC108746284 [Trachymyrmex septentrionalis]|uniref:uncharacterized protein LOC108746284 n=1 Tax=Trachymyrmex septentrionalis TaxID=34720 RepID=UPI00084F77E4|nr:PREDICTED: uncharacterized protein LOC108746284 [Trachymyrmex septentrionalis]
MGKEFYNADVQKSLKKYNVNHYSTLKVSVVERFNRTLKNDMWKMFTLYGNYKWVELPRLVPDYNSRKHRTISMRPADVTSAIAERLLGTGYTPNWTTEMFTIFKVPRTNSVTYLFEDYRGKSIAGAFYEHNVTNLDVNLVEKVLRKKGDKVYVKWLGFDRSHNS